MRKDRSFNKMRDISFETNVNIHADGACVVKFGNTHVSVSYTHLRAHET